MSDDGISTIGEAYIRPAIDHVIGMMGCSLDDYETRKKISTSMRRAVNMSTQAGGDIDEPKKEAGWDAKEALDFRRKTSIT